MTTLRRGDAVLNLVEQGKGLPVVFQHGLGGDESQVVEILPTGPWRRLTLECRGHGASTAGTRRPFSIRDFGDDVLAACDGFDRFVVGGISMGAAIALNLACRHPRRIIGLVIARPAWLLDAAPPNLRPYAEVAAALRAAAPGEAKARFAVSATARRLAVEAPDNLASLLGFFDRPDPQLLADLLDDIANDGPGVRADDVAALDVPTLVLGNRIDAAHPLAYAQELARRIPKARFVELPPKATDKPGYVAAFRAELGTFLHAMTRASEPTG